MVTLAVSVIVCLLGLVLFWFSPEPSKARRLGEMMFFAGLLASLLTGTPLAGR